MSKQEASQELPSQPAPDGGAPKRPVSERKIQANRRNALRSTGPKTARGKRTVARNAIKYGFLAREVVLEYGDGKETQRDFNALAEGLCEYYEPVGVVEQSLVQTIPACWWRKARVIRAENGEIRKRLDTHAVDSALRRSDKASLDLALTTMDLGWLNYEDEAYTGILSKERQDAMQSAQESMRGHPSGLDYMFALLTKARADMTSQGYICEGTRYRIRDAFCFWDYILAMSCFKAGPPIGEAKDSSPNSISDEKPRGGDVNTIALIDKGLKKLCTLYEFVSEREMLQIEAEARSLCLPDEDAMDKLLRYEAHLDRQLYRAMDELERLQRRRRGEKVPPPLNVNFGRRA